MPRHRTTASFSASQFRKLQAIVGTRPNMRLLIYGRGRHRTLALCRCAEFGRVTEILAKTHYTKATADEAAEKVARALTLDGELPIGMRGPS